MSVELNACAKYVLIIYCIQMAILPWNFLQKTYKFSIQQQLDSQKIQKVSALNK